MSYVFRLPSKQIEIRRIEDFPTPTDTGDGNGIAIHLENGYKYLISAPLIENPYTIVTPSDYGNAVFTGMGDSLTIYKYIGTGTAFICSNSKFGQFGFDRITISCPNGRLLDFETDDDVNGGYFYFDGCFVTDVYDVGYMGQYIQFDHAFYSAFFDIGYGIKSYNNYDLAFSNASFSYPKIISPTTYNITNITQANPCVVTIDTITSEYRDKDAISFSGIGGMTELNDSCFLIDNVTVGVSETTFELRDIDSTGYTAYTSGGSSDKPQIAFSIFGTQQYGIDFASFPMYLESPVWSFYLSPRMASFNINIRGVQFNDINGALYNDIFYLDSKTQSNISVVASGNFNLEDSTVSVEGYLKINALRTTNTARYAWHFINATDYVFENEERITGYNTGFFQYNGVLNEKLKGDANIAFQPASSTHTLSASFCTYKNAQIVVTFTNGTDVVNETSTQRNDGDLVTFKNSSGTMPTGLFKDRLYYVVNKTTNTFQLSDTLGGSAVTFTTDGTGSLYYNVAFLHGSTPERTISATAEGDTIPQAIIEIEPDDFITVVIANLTSASVGIDVTKTYIRIFK